MSGPEGTPNGVDRLAEIETREIAGGPRFLTLWEQTALVDVAKAAGRLYQAYLDRYPALAEEEMENVGSALARLDSGATEEDA